MSDSLGEIWRITSFGESHGRCVGVLIEGCPAGLALAESEIQQEVDKRKPHTGSGQTTRTEEDKVEILSGVFNGYTTGAPICMLVWNKDTDSSTYEKVKNLPRPGHADYTAFIKYGGFNDYRGGGRFSGRVTVGMVMAGAVAKKLIASIGIQVAAYTVQIGGIKAEIKNVDEIIRNRPDNWLHCPDPKAAKAMSDLIQATAKEGDSLGGVIEGLAINVPAGLGEPYFDSLEGQLSKALFAIPSVKGVEFGAGFSAAEKRGSENNDQFSILNKKAVTTTNNAGGILGGISNGMPLVVRAAIKPVPSISKKQDTIDLQKMESSTSEIQGRHDTCVVPRAVIVVESMIALTLCDFALRAGMIGRIINGSGKIKKTN